MNQYDTNGILKPEFVRTGRIPRPEGWMENPYIGKDGQDYHSVEALIQANADYNDRMFQKKPVKVDLTPIKTMDELR
jgi:hypothetical protein